jgi:ATPase subunit of ABC transporter with duplicated ATPase domains
MFAGAVVVASHDRSFLETVCTQFLEPYKGALCAHDTVAAYLSAKHKQAQASSALKKKLPSVRRRRHHAAAIAASSP